MTINLPSNVARRNADDMAMAIIQSAYNAADDYRRSTPTMVAVLTVVEAGSPEPCKPVDGEPCTCPVKPLLLDIEPIAMCNPFAAGALLPEVLTTRNSTYTFRYHALCVGEPQYVTVSCTKGTFEGEHWLVEAADVHLYPAALIVEGRLDLHTSRILTVNDYPVSTWGYPVI